MTTPKNLDAFDIASLPTLERRIEAIKELQADNTTLRRYVAHNHGCLFGLYTDDGELQCSLCGIDFRRMKIKDIFEKLQSKT